MAEQKDMHLSSLARTPKLQLAAEKPSIGECWTPPKKIPHVQGRRRNSNKVVGREKSQLESNPLPTRHTQRAQTLCTPGPRDPTETEPELCLNVSCKGTVQRWAATGAGALGAAHLGMASALLEEVAIKPTIEPLELTQGKQALGGHKQNLVSTRTQEKGAVTPQEADPDLPMSVQESLAEAWVESALLRGQGHWLQQCMHGAF